MYEMEGVSSAPPGQIGQSPGLAEPYGPPAKARPRRESSVSRSFPPPGVSPGWCPFPTVKVFLSCRPAPRKSYPPTI